MSLSLLTILFFVISYFASYFLIGKVRDVVIYKQILDNPNTRSSHHNATPLLGGLAFYIIIMLSLYFISPFDNHNKIMSLIPGLTILFITGLKDDLVVLAPLSKLIAQTAAALFLVFHFRFNIDQLHGFMGIDNMPSYIAAPIAVIIIVSIINAVNLIDGIDGLAATVSIVMFSIFGIIFYALEQTAFFFLCIVLIALLVSFLQYNLSSKKKIFMGDTGSMILGFLLGALTVRILALDINEIVKLPFHFENIPYVVASILFVPLFDTGRVFIIRILHRKNPFTADRSHIHHILIDKFNISHGRASFLIGLVNFLIVVLFSILAMKTTQWLLLGVFATVTGLAVLFFYVLHNSIYMKKLKIGMKKRIHQQKRLKIFKYSILNKVD